MILKIVGLQYNILKYLILLLNSANVIRKLNNQLRLNRLEAIIRNIYTTTNTNIILEWKYREIICYFIGVKIPFGLGNKPKMSLEN